MNAGGGINAPAAAKQSLHRAVALLWILQGNTFHGLRLKQIAETAGQSPSTTLRDLRALEAEGVVERIAGNDQCWRLSPRLIQVAVAHQHEMSAVQRRLDDLNQRCTRTPS